MARTGIADRVTCPCCGYPTLEEPGAYEICPLCWWEDDGQDDPHAEEVWGGPNHGYSLAQARQNFRRHRVMYEPERDARIGGPDSEAEHSAKLALMDAFQKLESAAPADRAALESEIRLQERRLQLERKRKIREYEAAEAGSRPMKWVRNE